MAAFDPATLDRWRALAIVDRDGTTVGTISEFYLDRETGYPTWALVNTGLFGATQTFVPLVHATEISDGLQVPYAKNHIKDTPRVDPHDELTPDEEAALFAHYGVEYRPAPGDEAGSGEAGAGVGSTEAGAAGAAGPVPGEPEAVEAQGPVRGGSGWADSAATVPPEPGAVEGPGPVPTEPGTVEGPGPVPAEPGTVEGPGPVPQEPGTVEGPGATPEEPTAAASAEALSAEPATAEPPGLVPEPPAAQRPGSAPPDAAPVEDPGPLTTEAGPADPLDEPPPSGPTRLDLGTSATADPRYEPHAGEASASTRDEVGSAAPDDDTLVAPGGFAGASELRDTQADAGTLRDTRQEFAADPSQAPPADPDPSRTAPVEPGLPGSTAAAPGPLPTTIDRGDAGVPPERPADQAGWPPGFDENAPADRPAGASDRWREAKLAAERDRIARAAAHHEERSPLERARRRLERLVGVGQDHPDDISPEEREAAERARRGRLGLEDDDPRRR